jgi:3-methyl-2-oxobutanoate hydroxymethyltransferase
MGVFALVLEGIPAALGKTITKRLRIPTIGIGAGAGCDGQILVLDDLLGISQQPPKFVKKYADLRILMKGAVSRYRSDVLTRRFPTPDHSYH